MSKKAKKLLPEKIGYAVFIVIGFLFSFFFVTEKELAEKGNIVWTAGYTIKTLGVSLLSGTILGTAICFFLYVQARTPWKQKKKKKHRAKNGITNLLDHFFQMPPLLRSLTYLLGIFLCWLPGYLAYYPGICAYDTNVQMGQVVDGTFTDHHPIMHTLLLKGCVNLGETVFQSVNVGVGIYIILQMLILAGAFSFALTMLEQFEVKRYWGILLWICCMIFPFHRYMSISVIKDTLFAAFFLIQIIAFTVLLMQGDNSLHISKMDMVYFFSTIGMILFRNNGKYAMIVLLVVQFIVFLKEKVMRKLMGRLFFVSFIAFLAGNMILSGLFQLTNAEQGDRREMLSIPIQQLARCMVYHGGLGMVSEDDNTISDEDKALIQDFILNEAYRNYRPDISDPVKSHTNTYVVRYRLSDFVKTYFKLLTQYPGDYINAVLALTAGYLYPEDVSHASININGTDRGLGYVQTRWADENYLNTCGLSKDSKWEGLYKRMDKWADENAYLQIPVLKYLFVPGTYLWLYFLLFGYLLIHRKFHMCLPLSLVLGYYITLFLGPTVQLRYIYPLMIILPFLVLLQTVKRKNNKNAVVQKQGHNSPSGTF